MTTAIPRPAAPRSAQRPPAEKPTARTTPGSSWSPATDGAIAEVLKRYWGYDKLRPLQKDAIDAGIAQRDSLVVLPTGGGKSLCYQVPPLVAGRVDVVVSPLISLMKDQVDALQSIGYPATALHSGLSEAERRMANADLLAGKHNLVFVAPERLLTPWFLGLAQRLNVRAFAIDEAHCISQWGHDFRPEYRQLAALKERFPSASLHAFTATATPRVRQDIIRQLNLEEPRLLVGRFDRPNLVYRVIPRNNLDEQVLATVRRHAGEAVIVYCISRADTEKMAETLRQKGVRAAHYHAGMDARERAKTQEAFAAERLDVVVATVAFGMGIDRSNVRCVIHAAMPKSVEHYQQETGRAGRDGLEAECVLFFSHADVRKWEFVMSKAAPGQTKEVLAAQMELLRGMQRFAAGNVCRHAGLSRYFGQAYETENCGACDVCLGERESPQVIVQPKSEADGWAGVDRGLFESLRELRRQVAAEQNVAAFIVFGDATLRELARVRPATVANFSRVRGVGERKTADLGARFVQAIVAYCRDHRLPLDQPESDAPAPSVRAPRRTTDAGNDSKKLAFNLFAHERSLSDVEKATGRTLSTVVGYLEDYIVERRPASVEPWVDADTYRDVEQVARKTGCTLLRPVFEALDERVDYESIRIVMRYAGLR